MSILFFLFQFAFFLWVKLSLFLFLFLAFVFTSFITHSNYSKKKQIKLDKLLLLPFD